jgi:putative (di)nucleoside polyphosphate hydrolase
MVLNRDGQVWIGRRIGSERQEGAGGWWQMPQGGIDKGEEPAAAALRELREETGMRSGTIIAESRDWHPYDLPPHLMGRIWGGKYRGQTQKWFVIRFRGEESEIDIEQTDHEPEFDAWRWAPVEEVLALIVPFKRDVYARVIAEFRSLAIPEALP